VTEERARAVQLEAAQEQLRQAQKLEAVGQLTGGVAHDFNNLLTVIRGSVELLMRPGIPEDRRTRYIQAIADTSARATKLTSQLLAFARRQALRPEVFDVGQSIGAVGDIVRSLTGSRITIETRLPEEPVFINADPSQFDTALVNLAVNARDAMDGEGRLTITVETASTPPGAETPGEFVAVALSDTGAGIDAHALPQIFEPFFTTKGVGQGTGLGLSQVYGFAKQSGGDIRVESECGRGSTFTLYLPRAEAPGAQPRESVAAEPLVNGQGSCILVVEDNAQVGQFATGTLAELGFHTVLAPDAAAALAELDKDAARFDVVFSDVVMPG
jgi:signal transduction histidine kinase